MSTLLPQMDQKQAAGVKATGFWVLEAGISAEIRYEDGTSVGPFIFGTDYGVGCDRANSSALAKRVFNLGLMEGWADSVTEAHRLIREVEPDQVNKLFSGDLMDPSSIKLRV